MQQDMRQSNFVEESPLISAESPGISITSEGYVAVSIKGYERNVFALRLVQPALKAAH